MADAADRLRRAAFDLFENQGYDATTVDEIADRAGVGRTTFFRHFRTKDEVVLPDHTEVLARVRARLDAAGPETAPVAVTDAARLVLRHYLDEGDLARSRYRLTRTVPALRAREIAHLQQYQRVFREFLRQRTGEQAGHDVRAELAAASVVVGHNHVLRRWLRGLTTEPEREFEEAMALVTGLHLSRPGRGSTVVVVESSRDADAVATAVRRALAEPPTG